MSEIVNKSDKRINWIDQVRGITIFLVVYGHNFPFNEKYIYSFHMPLFIILAGFFHSKTAYSGQIQKRAKAILVPYFIWSTFLFFVWFFVTSRFGENVQLRLSPLKNFIGVFYAQGDRDYMDWGIPMWFLPAIFLTFLIFHFILKIKSSYLMFATLILLIGLGFFYSGLGYPNLPWSINIAFVCLCFYTFGFYSLDKINSIPKKTSILLALLMGLANFLLYSYNIKIDMYRAIYGNEFLFIVNGLTGSLFLIFLFRSFPLFGFLAFIGKFSLVILALQLLAMSFIKFVLLYLFGPSDFNFSEWERFGYAVLQITLMIPAFFIINKYIPILNGGYKKI
ncbi:acyltransferase family protein [Flavobacterium sp.]